MSGIDPFSSMTKLGLKDQFLAIDLDQIDLEIIKGKRTFALSNFKLKELLTHIKHPIFFYFSPPDESYEILSIGIAEKFNQEKARHFILHSPQDWLYYYDTFESGFSKDETTSILGEWVFYRNNQECSLRVHTKLSSKQIPLGHELFEANSWESFMGPWIEYEESPEHDEWEKMISSAHDLFDSNKLKKIVLSRKKKFKYSESIDNKALFLELLEANQSTRSFKIINQLSENEAFISLTPERLFKLTNNEIETIALAGSTLRGENQPSDQELSNELNDSHKLIVEHQYVIDDIKSKLSSIAINTVEGKMTIMKLPYIQHRMSEIKATLKDNITPYNLIKSLHPTAAVGGLPTSEALKEILVIEKTPRHFYAGPIGILSAHFSEIAVGIRSAFVRHDTITLFGGAGIVRESVAEEEWQETGTKMKPFLNVINKSII